MLVDDVWHLADTGYGTGLLFPCRWSRRHLVAGRLDLPDGPAGRRQLAAARAAVGHWFTHYTVPPEDTFFVDVAAANWVTSTSPTSRFTPQLVVQRKDESLAHLLTGRQLVVESPAGVVSKTSVSDDALDDVLRATSDSP